MERNGKEYSGWFFLVVLVIVLFGFTRLAKSEIFESLPFDDGTHFYCLEETTDCEYSNDDFHWSWEDTTVSPGYPGDRNSPPETAPHPKKEIFEVEVGGPFPIKKCNPYVHKLDKCLENMQ